MSGDNENSGFLPNVNANFNIGSTSDSRIEGKMTAKGADAAEMTRQSGQKVFLVLFGVGLCFFLMFWGVSKLVDSLANYHSVMPQAAQQNDSPASSHTNSVK